jgi:Ca2+-transporting ATPase
VRAGGWRDLARETARDPMLAFLAATAAVYAAVGQYAEAVTLVGAMLPLAGMDAFLHRRAQASAEGLRARLTASATVVRDGRVHDVPVTDLVPGDLVVTGAGQPVPADGVILAGDGLLADESLLTGEAYAVAKRPLATLGAGDEPLVDGAHWAFAGTRLLTGPARLRVVFTGGDTLYGEIVRSATAGAQPPTALQRGIARLVRRLVVAATVVCAAVGAARLWQGHGWLDAVVSAVTLAAAAIPEEFPVVFAFFLGVGAWRLAKRQALVRRGVSVENIGRITAICTDKTGTLTEGRLRLTHLAAGAGHDDARLLAVARAASRPETGDPLDVALAAESDARAGHGTADVLRTFPFTEARRRETAVVRDADGAVLAMTKGAVETVLTLTALPEADRAAWRDRAERLAHEGHRVVAAAWRAVDDGTTAEPDDGYALAGLLAFADPVRATAAAAVTACAAAGIRVVMVTGDHPGTAAAVARAIGLGGSAPHIIVGDDLDRRPVAAGGLGAVDVVARAAPAQKLRLVRALQAEGEIVAVTGDGVNDVPALQAADVGIAMGERGTRSAREAAAIVLLDDDFRTIVGAIREGRQLFRNLRASFEYLLAIHVPLVVAAALVPLAGYPLLYLPSHIVWLELLLHPTALLVFQAPADVRLEPTRRGQPTGFFGAAHWIAIGLVGGLLTLVVVVAYVTAVREGGDPEHGRAMALAVMSLASAALAAALSRLRTMAARTVVAASIALPVGLLAIGPLARALHVAPLHAGDWALAAAVAAATFGLRRALAGVGLTRA